MEITQKKQGQATIFFFKGRLDSNSAPAAEKTLVEAITKGERHLVFDLKDLEYLSSAGIRILVHCHKKVEHEHGHIYLSSIPKPIENVLYITGFLPYFQTFASPQEAANALTKAVK